MTRAGPQERWGRRQGSGAYRLVGLGVAAASSGVGSNLRLPGRRPHRGNFPSCVDEMGEWFRGSPWKPLPRAWHWGQGVGGACKGLSITWVRVEGAERLCAWPGTSMCLATSEQASPLDPV